MRLFLIREEKKMTSIETIRSDSSEKLKYYENIHKQTMSKIYQGVSSTDNNSNVSSQEFIEMLEYLDNQLNSLPNLCFTMIGKSPDGHEMGFLGKIKASIKINKSFSLSSIKSELQSCVESILDQINLKDSKYQNFAIVIITAITGQDIPITVCCDDADTFSVSLLEENKVINYENFKKNQHLFDYWRIIPVVMNE